MTPSSKRGWSAAAIGIALCFAAAAPSAAAMGPAAPMIEPGSNEATPVWYDQYGNWHPNHHYWRRDYYGYQPPAYYEPPVYQSCKREWYGRKKCRPVYAQ